MKKTLLLLATIVVAMTACKQAPQVKQHEFVYDQYGVVQRIDTAEKNVYLVFTAHFSTDDNGLFENMDGLESVLNTLQEKGIKGSFFQQVHATAKLNTQTSFIVSSTRGTI